MVHLDSGNLESARSCAEEAFKIAQAHGAALFESRARTWLGRTLGKSDPSQVDEAEKYILQGIGFLDELQLRPRSSQGYLFLGELYADTGQKEKALKTLKKAESEFRDMGIDYWLRSTQEVLERVQG